VTHGTFSAWRRLVEQRWTVFAGWDVADGGMDALVVEPAAPLSGGEFDVVQAFPGLMGFVGS
jgi:hypothetical protein